MTYESYQKNLAGLSVFLRQSLEILTGKSDGTLFALSKNLKALNGQRIQSLLTRERIIEWMKLFCENNSGFVFDGEFLCATENKLVGTASYDAGRVLSVDELLRLTDLEYLFSINAYDFPYCDSTENRGVYQHFFDFLLKQVVPDSPHYRLLVESIPVLRVVVQEWFGIINCVAQLFQNINIRYKAFESIKASLALAASPRKEAHVIDDIVRWFERVELLRQDIMTSEPPPELAAFLESAINFKTMRMNALISTEGKKEDNKAEDADDAYLARVEQFNQTLFERIAGKDAIDVLMLESSKALFEQLSTEETKAFCEQCIAFMKDFENLLNQLKNPEGFYMQALTAGRKLMAEVAKAEAALYATRFNSPRATTPRSGDSTPRTPRGSERSPSTLSHAVSPMSRKSLGIKKSGAFFLDLGSVGSKTPSPSSSPATSQRTPRTPRPGSQDNNK